MASRGCVCFVGNLPGDVREREVEDLFYKVGLSRLHALRQIASPAWTLLKDRHGRHSSSFDHLLSFGSGVMSACKERVKGAGVRWSIKRYFY